MPISIREKVLAAITERVNGSYGVPEADDEQDLPITIVQEFDESSREDQYGVVNNEIPVAIVKAEQATSRDREELRKLGNELLASTIDTVFKDEQFDGLVANVIYTGGSTSSELGKFVSAEAQFTFIYETLRGDPYNQP